MERGFMIELWKEWWILVVRDVLKIKLISVCILNIFIFGKYCVDIVNLLEDVDFFCGYFFFVNVIF